MSSHDIPAPKNDGVRDRPDTIQRMVTPETGRDTTQRMMAPETGRRLDNETPETRRTPHKE